MARGLLIVFEGLDQSGKQTQAEALRDWLTTQGRVVRLLSFPTYETPIGAEIGRALHGERDYGADVMQLLYVANRFEWKPEIERELAAGTVLVCDRYLASSIAYGEAQGLDPDWLAEIQAPLPRPDLTAAARHIARRVAVAQAGRARQVRARPAAAQPRPCELHSPGRHRRVGDDRRQPRPHAR